MFNKDVIAQEFENYLTEYGVENYIRRDWQDGYQWIFPRDDDYGDVIYTPYSYNNEGGYVESMGFYWDEDDVSVLPPKEMARRIAGREPQSELEYHYGLAECIASLIGAIKDGN